MSSEGAKDVLFRSKTGSSQSLYPLRILLGLFLPLTLIRKAVVLTASDFSFFFPSVCPASQSFFLLFLPSLILQLFLFPLSLTLHLYILLVLS